MQNRIDRLFETRNEPVLSIFLTAGFPKLEDTIPAIEALAAAGVDMIEVGMPFSDPLADGPTIQHSSEVALKNGMTLSTLFEQLAGLREKVDIPLLLMGYLNPLLQFGIPRFCESAARTGIDGLIIPDLPLKEYLEDYQALFHQQGLKNILLITPQTSEARIQEIDRHSGGFIYAVSSAATTGTKSGTGAGSRTYFQRLRQMGLRNPLMIGFGIADHAGFEAATRHANGAIVGSAFIKAIAESTDLSTDIRAFVRHIKHGAA